MSLLVEIDLCMRDRFSVEGREGLYEVTGDRWHRWWCDKCVCVFWEVQMGEGRS